MAIFLARQPILDSYQRIVAYELLFRSSAENFFSNFNGDKASLSVVGTTLYHIGLERLVGNKKAFINFTKKLLLEEYATLLPKDRVVVEILEDIEPSSQVLEACLRLRKDGYKLALDDVCSVEDYLPFDGVVDIVKIDFRKVEADLHKSLSEFFLPKGLTMLAEKVETQAEWERAKSYGYTLFQGYFFSKPILSSSKETPLRKKSEILLLNESLSSDFTLDRAEKLFKRDPILSFLLFKYVNSAAFGFRRKISSVRHALVVLGEKNLRKFVITLIITGLSKDKPALLTQAVVRARFCENLAHAFSLKDSAEELFITGLFSLLDAILDLPYGEILKLISLSDEVSLALYGKDSPYTDVLELVKSYEKGLWDSVSKIALKHGIEESILPDLYQEALQWAQVLTEGY